VTPLEVRVQKSISLGLFLVTLAILPNYLIDAVNVPKLLVLSILGLGVLGVLLTELRLLGLQVGRVYLALTGFFVLAAFSAFFAAGPSAEQFFGDWGRSTGLLAYLSLAILALGVAFVANSKFASKLLAILVLVGGINAIYGLFQWLGFDPIDWFNPYSPIVGTLGNPNFTSALFGISATAALAFACGEVKLQTRLSLIVAMSLMLFLSYVSDAIQGVAVFLIGLTVIAYSRFLGRRGLGLRIAYLATVLIGGVFAILGILQRGPLAAVLYQDSVTFRGDYWRAGWQMTINNPIFGLGLDGYGDWYRASRTLAATERRGPEVVANSAHNVFLDLSSGGGFPLLLAYLFICGLAIRAAFRIIMRSENFDFVGTGLVACWIGYIAQSLISINQLALAIWGWALTGALIGYDRYSSAKNSVRAKSRNTSAALPPKAILAGFAGLLAGFFLALGPFVKDARVAQAVKTGSPELINEAATLWPNEHYYHVFLSGIFADNELFEEALKYAKLAVAANDRAFTPWEFIYKSPVATESEKAEALGKMKELDPLNPNYKDK